MRFGMALGGRGAQGRLQDAPPGVYSGFGVTFWPKMGVQGRILAPREIRKGSQNHDF